MELKRYSVKCMFQTTYYAMGGRQLPRVSWVERMFYIRAADPEDSYRRAEELALEYECDYTNEEHQLVCCRLYEISDSCEILCDRMQSGTELYTNFFDASEEEVEALLRCQFGEKGAPTDSVS